MLDLNDAKEEGTLNENKYQEVGVWDNIRINTIMSGKSFTKQTPFIRIGTEGPNGELCESGDMYVSTDVKEGSTLSAWSVTARKLVNLIMAVTGKSEDEAKAACKAADADDLAKKLSAILVGKPFRGVFYGEEIQGKEGKNNWVKAYFAINGTNKVKASTNYAAESMKVAKSASKLKFDESKHVQKLPVGDSTTVKAATVASPWD